MNDPFEVIKKDHESVEALFKEFENVEDDPEERKWIVEKLAEALTLHAEMEETICYPQFKEALKPEDQALLDEAYTEHQETKTTLEHLTSLEETGTEFEEGVKALMEQVRHHVHEEEQEIIPKVKQEVPPEVLSAMGDDMMTFKESKGGIAP
jgi:hemerythrin superfamily protein